MTLEQVQARRRELEQAVAEQHDRVARANAEIVVADALLRALDGAIQENKYWQAALEQPKPAPPSEPATEEAVGV